MRCKRFYTGPFYLKEDELKVKYGSGNTIFLEHMFDLFATGVPSENIMRILAHSERYDENKYVLQTKNPGRLIGFSDCFNERYTLGTTIETNRADYLCLRSKTPEPSERAAGLRRIGEIGFDTFLTIEPAMDFNPLLLSQLVSFAQPDFVNIGLDSKNSNLPEPTRETVEELLRYLNEVGIEVRIKSNMERLHLRKVE